MVILYNTVMGLAAGTALLLLVAYARRTSTTSLSQLAWGLTFGLLGAVLTVLAVAMNLTWPLPGPANIIFGEPSLLFGVVLMIWAALVSRAPAEPGIPTALREAARPVVWLAGLLGVMVITLGITGAAFGQFRPAPGEWPGVYLVAAGVGWLETVYVVLTFSVAGASALLAAAALDRPRLDRPTMIALTVAGLLVLGLSFGALVGHISLAVASPPGGFRLGG